MLTRAFLLLLAMMTGLSAAQAEGSARAAAAKHSMRAASAQLIADDAVMLAKAQSPARVLGGVAQAYSPRPVQSALLASPQLQPFSRTYRSDRARE